MDSTKLILTQPVLPPALLEHLDGTAFSKRVAEQEAGKIDGFSEEQKKQIAKDFESVLLNQLLDEMKNTIGDWGFDKDGASEQVQGIFWLYLARDIANKGGFGLWKDIYQFLTDSADTSTAAESLDKNI
jgi:Rod binding domain-containing protein